MGPVGSLLFALIGTDPVASMRAEASGWIAVTLIAAIVGTLRDATARARREAEERRRAEERHAIVLRGANDGIWEWDLVANRIAFTGRWHELLGQGAEAAGEGPPSGSIWASPCRRSRAIHGGSVRSYSVSSTTRASSAAAA